MWEQWSIFLFDRCENVNTNANDVNKKKRGDSRLTVAPTARWSGTDCAAPLSTTVIGGLALRVLQLVPVPTLAIGCTSSSL